MIPLKYRRYLKVKLVYACGLFIFSNILIYLIFFFQDVDYDVFSTNYYVLNVFKITETYTMFKNQLGYHIHYKDITSKVIMYMRTSQSHSTTLIHFDDKKTKMSDIICMYCTLHKFIDKKELHLIHFVNIPMTLNEKVSDALFLRGDICYYNKMIGNSCKLMEETKKKVNERKTIVKIINKKKLWRPPYINLDCEKVISGDSIYIKEAVVNRITYKNIFLDMDCKSIHDRGFDFKRKLNDIEEKYSLAYARNVYQNYEVIEMNLKMHYSIRNHYCYVVDSKSPQIYEAMLKLEKCIPNVYVLTETLDMNSNGENGPLANYMCMKLLLKKKWDYMFIMQNDDVPLFTNKEQLEILEAMDFPLVMSFADVDYYHPERLDYSVSWLYKDLEIFLEGDPRKKNEEIMNQKMYFHYGTIVSGIPRKSIEYIVNDLNITKYINLLSTSLYGSDELVWSTLFADEIIRVPFGVSKKCAPIYFPGDTYLGRHIFWYGGCGTNFLHHSVCTYGLETLPTLKTLKPFFGYRFKHDTDFGAMYCWAEHIYRKTYLDEVKTVDLWYYYNSRQSVYMKLHLKGEFEKIRNCRIY